MKIVCGACRPNHRRKTSVISASGGAVILSAAFTVAAIHLSVSPALRVTAAVSPSDAPPPAVVFSVSAVPQSPPTVDDEIDLLLGDEEIDSGKPAGYDGRLDIPKNVRLDRLDFGSDFAKPLDKARVTSRFDYRVNPVTGRYVFHTGIDLGAPQGANIYAMRDGKVVRAAYDGGYGNFVILEHANGIRTLYAHCSKRKVKEGSTVRQGDVIALVGSTGNSTGPHLHLEFRRGSCRYDPEWVIGGLYS